MNKRINAQKRKSTGWSPKLNSKEARTSNTTSLIGWTPHPTVKLIVGPTEEVILIHRKIIKELKLFCNEKKDPVSIPIPNVDPQCLRILLNYIYNDELNIVIENVWNILVTAWQFSHSGAQTVCIDFIVDNIKKFDCWEMWRSARLYEMTELVLYVENYAARDLEFLKIDSSFLELPYDEVMKFFQSEEVCKSSSRVTRCNAAIAWIEHDIDERQSHICSLMTEVNLQSLPAVTQNNILANHSILAKNSEWMKLQEEELELPELDLDETSINNISIALNIFENDDPDISIEDVVVKIEQEDLDREIRQWPVSEEDIVLDSDDDISVPLMPSLHLPNNDTLVVISGTEQSGYRAVWSYDVVTKRKLLLANVEARISDSFVCRNNVLYHLGGRKGDFVSKDVYSLKLLSEQLWEPCPPMTVSRWYFSAVVMKGNIYAIGGNIGEGDCVMNTVEVLKFDGESRSNEWQLLAYLNRSRDAYGVTVDDEDTIYVVGGCGQTNKRSKTSSVLPLVEEYSDLGGLWTSSKQLRQKRMFHGVVYLDGYIYAIGGFDGTKALSSMECYDGDFHGKWEKCPSMKTARKEMSTVVLRGCIYVFGGKGDKDEPLLSTEVYDPKTKCWSFSDIIPESEGPFHSVLVKC